MLFYGIYILEQNIILHQHFTQTLVYKNLEKFYYQIHCQTIVTPKMYTHRNEKGDEEDNGNYSLTALVKYRKIF